MRERQCEDASVPARTPAPPPSSRNDAALRWLAGLPRLTVPAVVLALTLAGLSAPPAIGAPCLLLVVLFLGWLASLAWPVLDQRGRALRLLTMGLLIGAAIARSVGAL